MGTSKKYPMVFTFPEVIVGNGFSARVEIQGRALLVEDDDVWIYGVQPASFAGGGENYETARREFKMSYLSVLFDVAASAPTFEAFDAEVRAFFATTNDEMTTEWEAALADVRKNSTSLAGFSKVPAENMPPKIKIAKLDQQSMRPDLNKFDTIEVVVSGAAA